MRLCANPNVSDSNDKLSLLFNSSEKPKNWASFLSSKDTYATIDLKDIGVRSRIEQPPWIVRLNHVFLQYEEILGIKGRNQIVGHMGRCIDNLLIKQSLRKCRVIGKCQLNSISLSAKIYCFTLAFFFPRQFDDRREIGKWNLQRNFWDVSLKVPDS